MLFVDKSYFAVHIRAILGPPYSVSTSGSGTALKHYIQEKHKVCFLWLDFILKIALCFVLNILTLISRHENQKKSNIDVVGDCLL